MVGKKLTEQEARSKILSKCLEKDVEFIGFNNDENRYKNNKTYLILKCNKCGNVWHTTSYDKFVNGNRCCPNCMKNKTLTESEILETIKKICEEKDFTFLGFNGCFSGTGTKLLLKCNKCGYEWGTTTLNNFKRDDRKLHTCGRRNPAQMPSIFDAEKATLLINNKLKDTSLSFISFDENGYIGSRSTYVLLKCKKCGKIIKYSYRTCVSGPIKCKNCESGKFSDKYARSLVTERCKELNYTFLGFDNKENNYAGKNTYLILKCNKCGTLWKTTTFASFCRSIIKCPGCVNSWKMEKEIETYLTKNNIKYIKQCRSNILPWLKNKISLSLDFFLPDHKLAIECQGRQHFEPVLEFGGEKSFNESVERDKKKLALCEEHKVDLLYYDSELGHTEFLGKKVYNDEYSILRVIMDK